jgi:hypothetical protein
MKTIIYTTLFLLAGNASAQTCNFVIPPHVPVPGGGSYHIYSNTTINDQDGSTYYICAGLNVVVEYSAGCNYVLEDGVTLTLNDHEGDNIIAKGNCTVVDNTTEGVVINMEATSTFSKPNLPSAGVVFICGTMVYDYSVVGGSSPCSGAGIETPEVDQAFLLYPNPIEGNGVLNVGTDISEVHICDLTGRRVASYQDLSQSFITLDNLGTGIFVVRMKTVRGTQQSSRLVVK